MVKERKKKYVRIRLDRGWVTAVTKKGEVLMEKVVPEEDLEAARHHMKKKKKKHKKKKKGKGKKKGEDAPRETEWGEKPAPEASAGGTGEGEEGQEEEHPGEAHPAHPAFDDGNIQTAAAIAEALATHLNTEPPSYAAGDQPKRHDESLGIGFDSLYDTLQTTPESRRQHRFATAIGVLESALFQLSHADESEAATRNMKAIMAYSDADRHLEEMDEALGLFGY